MNHDNDHYYYDENGEFIIQPPKDYDDPFISSCASKRFICTKCYATSYSPSKLKLHSENCNPQFSNIIYRDNDYSVAHVTSESPREEKRICEWLMTVEADEADWKYDSLTSQKWETHRFQVFLMLQKSTISAAAIIQKAKIQNENERQEDCILVSHIFTLYSQRRKHYMEKLLSVILEKLGASFGSAVFQRDFSKNGEACLTGIAKKQGLKSIRTFYPQLEYKIRPFPIP